jgi:hypothetical protein
MLAAERVASQSPWPSRSPTCSSCARAKAAPRACKARSAATSPPSRRAARTSSSSSWPPPRSRPSRSSRP